MKNKIIYIFVISFIFSSNTDIIKIVDQLNYFGQYDEELYELEKAIQIYPDNIELLWRLSRAHFEIADQSNSKEIHRKHFYPALNYARSALDLNSNSAIANHWYSVLIGKIGLLEGTEQKIKNSYDVKKHALKAIDLDPTNDGTYHVLGRWYFEVASLSWIERKMAEIIYTKPPVGTYDEAIFYFKKAIEIKNDEIRHYYWIAKTYIAMNKFDQAKKYLNEIINLEPLDDSDKKMKLESLELLKDV
tara:strand:+ start:3995 stop:4732 length:738 start_codon:yes stop_codon:yes gene_type:complete